MPGVVQQYVEEQQHDREMAAHEELYQLMRERHTPEEVSRQMNLMVQEQPGIKSPEMLTEYTAELEAEMREMDVRYDQGRTETYEKLRTEHAHNWIHNDLNHQNGLGRIWSIQDAREDVQILAHSENDWITTAHRNGIGQYADEPFRMGARQGVMEFSRELNHKLLQQERQELSESVSESPRMRMRI